MTAVSTSGITSGFLGKLRTQVKAVLDGILAAVAFTYTAGQRYLTIATSATNPQVGVSAGFLRFVSGIGAKVSEITAATYAVVDADFSLIANRAGTITLTLPAAASYTDRMLLVRTITANTVVSGASNVVPVAGGAAGTAILAGTAGKWAILQSDGTNWQIVAAG